ncbi:hypothetical protein H5T87_10555 [bacterium]|nr:hypothetical protein [bacterium]
MRSMLCSLVILCGIWLLGNANEAHSMTILSNEVMASIKGASLPPPCGTETLCNAYFTCIKGVGGCVKLPTSLPALQSNSTDNMSNQDRTQCGNIWTEDCRATTTGCGGLIINSVDP